MSRWLSRTRLIALDRLTSPIIEMDKTRMFLDSLVIFRGFEIAKAISNIISNAGRRYFGPRVRSEGSISEIAAAAMIAIVAGRRCSWSDLNPNCADSKGAGGSVVMLLY